MYNLRGGRPGDGRGNYSGKDAGHGVCAQRGVWLMVVHRAMGDSGCGWCGVYAATEGEEAQRVDAPRGAGHHPFGGIADASDGLAGNGASARRTDDEYLYG